jgi:cob(I)alamin adenosyltransferase
MRLEKGYIQVYTGNGKGKTTAALGLAFRAAGRKIKVCMIQFMKGGAPCGEHLAAELLAPYLTIIRTGREGRVNRQSPDPEDVRHASDGVNYAKQALACGEYGIVILDEINGAVAAGLVDLEEVISLLQSKPDDLELVLTGRNAHERILAAADLVTEMRDIKHYFRAGVFARSGIER